MKSYLTDEEIEELTKPLTQGAARCRLLERMGFKVEPRGDGQPIVGRAHFEQVMGGRRGEAANDGQEGTTNFSALRNRVRYGRDGAKT